MCAHRVKAGETKLWGWVPWGWGRWCSRGNVGLSPPSSVAMTMGHPGPVAVLGGHQLREGVSTSASPPSHLFSSSLPLNWYVKKPTESWASWARWMTPVMASAASTSGSTTLHAVASTL